ncbi:sde2 [Symbiodinium sp. CCMP2592]|nr:sde2 [Symbiodinium sp. CCMP2592]
MAGVIAQLPGGTSRFVPVEPSLLGGPLDTAELLRHFLDAELFARRSASTSSDDDVEELASAFGHLDLEESIEVEEYRVLYQGRDLECEKTAAQFLESLEDGRPCFVRISFRLLGGKGGFGSLLRSQKGGKKTTNFDAMRDLNGRRVRHVKAVERIKEWLEKKKREDELVNLLTGEGPELPKPTPESESLDPEFVRKLKRSAQKSSLVSEGIQRWISEKDTESEDPKRPRTEEPSASSSAGPASASSAVGAAVDKEEDEDADDDDGVDWMGAMSALQGLSSPEPEEEGASSGAKRSD